MPGSRVAVKGKSASKAVRPRRDFEALRQRRLRAADMFRRGKSQAEVAQALGVSRESASKWYQLWSNGGRAALVGAGRAGRLPRLSADQLADVLAALKRGPRSNGFASDLWTLARVADVIEATTGVRYSQTQTWTILRDRLGWSRQRPSRRALERNEEAIANWVAKDWPRIKKRPAPGRLHSFSGRVRLFIAPECAVHLGPQRRDPGAAPPLQLFSAVTVGRGHS